MTIVKLLDNAAFIVTCFAYVYYSAILACFSFSVSVKREFKTSAYTCTKAMCFQRTSKENNQLQSLFTCVAHAPSAGTHD